ncbi:MAG: hypothetical protein MUD16_14070, partial [Desulfobacterales bacterium]|nr:hypothetical protein [Desulfobacterales bacterium]
LGQDIGVAGHQQQVVERIGFLEQRVGHRGVLLVDPGQCVDGIVIGCLAKSPKGDLGITEGPSFGNAYLRRAAAAAQPVKMK